MNQRILTVAANTFVETIRQPIYGVMLIVTAILMVLNVSLAAFTLENDDKLLLEIGLSTLLLCGLFLAAFSATGVVSREIENKTVLTVISKPIGRPAFIVGKFLGLLGAMLMAFYVGLLIFVLAMRHGVLQNTSDPWDAPVLVFGVGSAMVAVLVGAWCNYFYGKHFATVSLTTVTILLTFSVLLVGKFDEKWNVIPFGSNYVGGQVLLASYLLMLTIGVITAVALACSARLAQLPTLLVCLLFLAVGFIADYAFGQFADNSLAANLAYHIVPNLGPFWVVDALLADSDVTAIPLRYLGLATAYAALLTTAAVSVAVVLFQRREIG
ncbi:MAG: hypothetical protein J5J06_00865 [Phycisphaerae bacterium]|nr:hypothetical protein [Phycisphaerae bacterium]